MQRDSQTRLAAQSLMIAARGVEDHPRIGEGSEGLRGLSSLEKGLPPQLFTCGRPHEIVMTLVRQQCDSGLLQSVVDIPPLEKYVRQPHPRMGIVLLRRRDPRQNQTPPGQLQSLIQIVQIQVHGDGEVIHFGHLGGLLGGAVEIAGRDAGSQRFLVSVQKIQSAGLHLARIAGETVVLLVLSQLPTLTGGLQLVLGVPDCTVRIG